MIKMNAYRARRAFTLALTATLLASLPARAESAKDAKVNYDDPPQGVFVDDWMVVSLQDNKIGFAHSQIAREGDIIETTNLMSLVLRRAGQKVPITMLQTTRETLAGVPVSFTSQLDASAQTMEKLGRVENGRVTVRSDQFGMESKNEYDYPVGAVMSWGALRLQHDKGYETGTKYSVQIYEPTFSESSAVPVEMAVGEKEQIEIDGEKVDAIKTTQVMMGMTNITWIDGEGNVLRTQLPMMGMPMVMTRSTREQAMAEFQSPEFFMPTTIPSPRKIDRANTQQIEFVLSLKDDTVDLPKLPTTAMQTPSDEKPGSVHLTVKRLDHAGLAKTPPTKYGKDMSEFLAPNALINSDDPAVQAMAKEAKGDATTPYAIADNLRRYVTDVIKEKNLTVGFASASEVCRNKEGDCSEHAVLLAALGRACGLPSQVVTGLVYVPIFGGDEDIFGFHMWTQFRIGDTWVDFDAAQRESDCNATHIALSVGSLEGAGLGQIALNLVNVIGNLKIDIVDMK